MADLIADLRKVEGVVDVHDLHVWSISENLRVLSAHIVTTDTSLSTGAVIQRNLNEVLAHKYDIQHATLQLECEGCATNLLYCDIGEGSHTHEHISV